MLASCGRCGGGHGGVATQVAIELASRLTAVGLVLSPDAEVSAADLGAGRGQKNRVTARRDGTPLVCIVQVVFAMMGLQVGKSLNRDVAPSVRRSARGEVFQHSCTCAPVKLFDSWMVFFDFSTVLGNQRRLLQKKVFVRRHFSCAPNHDGTLDPSCSTTRHHTWHGGGVSGIGP